ncbi:MAG: preprotein translocase subunit SecG [Chloroflexi bacterium]|nr:preprotein translocase subunit SecG [Chloroflexota bacterium]
MQQYLQVIQIILSVALVAAVLLQARGAALGSAFGGSDTIHNTRRGVDRLLFNVTIGIATLFIIVSVVLVRI